MMSVAKIAISMDQELLNQLDELVEHKKFKSRSHAIQSAVEDKIAYLKHYRLAHECEKLDKEFERKLADEGLEEDEKEWPKF